jgi:hypothetical protein
MSGSKWRVFLVVLALGYFPVQAGAQSVAAIVEDVTGAKGPLRPLDYVLEGQTIELGPGGRIVLGYLGSCFRETVEGGSITVGSAQSTIAGGRVLRQKVQCDGGRLLLSKKEAEQSGVLVLRKGVQRLAAPKAPKPTEVYSLTPFFIVPGGPGRISVTRLDRPSTPITLVVKDGVVDLYESPHKLAPGARYQVAAGSKTVVFVIHPSATLNGVGVLGRLIAF